MISRKSTTLGGVVGPLRKKSVGLFNIEGYYTQILHKYAGWGHFWKFWICTSPWKFRNFPHSSRSTDALNRSVPHVFRPFFKLQKLLKNTAPLRKISVYINWKCFVFCHVLCVVVLCDELCFYVCVFLWNWALPNHYTENFL